MNLLGDLVAPERRSEELAYERPGERAQSYSYSAFCTDAWKAGNLMRHYGVREGATVGIVDGPKQPSGPEDRTGTPALPALVGFFGAALLGAEIRFDPPSEPDVRALVAPTAWLENYDLPPGSKALGFGANPEDPTVAQFERELWSENPIPFPSEFGPETTALQAENETFDHATLLSTAEAVVAEWDLTAEDAVAVDASLASPGAVVAGVLVPLLAGGTITVGGDSERTDAALVVSDTADGESVLRPADVFDYSPGRT